jgi:hypothetical protein
MKTEVFYQEYFAQCKSAINFNYFLKLNKLSQSRFSKYLNGNRKCFKLDECDRLYRSISETLKNIA